MITEYTTLGKKSAEIDEGLPRASRWNIEEFFDKDYHQKFEKITDANVSASYMLFQVITNIKIPIFKLSLT
jgi:hypothetical protein